MTGRLDDVFEHLHTWIQEERRLLFTLAMLLLYFLYLFYPLNHFLGFSLVNGVGMYSFAVLGAFYLYFRGARGGWALRFMLLFIVWTAISRSLSGDRVLLHEGYQVAVGLGALCFLGLGQLHNAAARRRLLLPLAIAAAAFYTALGLMTVYSCLSGRELLYPLTQAPTGQIDLLKRMEVLGTGPNFASVWFLLGSGAALWLFLRLKRWYWRVLCAVSLLILQLALASTQSRSAFVGYSVAAGVFAAALGLRYLRLRGVWRLGASALIFVLSFALAYNSLAESYLLLNDPGSLLLFGGRAAETAAVTPSAALPEGEDSESLLEEYRDPRSMNSSERGIIWVTTAELLLKDPGRLLHGCLYDERMPRINEALQAKGVTQFKPDCHNSLVEVLNYQGLPGFVCLLGFMAAVVWACLRVLLSGTCSLETKALTLPVLGILCYAQFESLLFVEFDIRSIAFYLLAGFVLAEARETGTEARV